MSEQNQNNSNLSTEEKKKQIISLLKQALTDVAKLRKEVSRLRANQEIDEFFET